MQTVLTPNHRLSAVLRKQLNAEKTQQGAQCWQSPDILPLQTFLQRLFEADCNMHCEAHPLLLSVAGEACLWKKIIEDSDNPPLQSAAMAGLAEKAWHLVKNWLIATTDPELAITEDNARFVSWATTFESVCEKNNWLAAVNLPEYLASRISAGKIILPEKIVLYGFSELSPAHQQFFAVIKEQGTDVTTVQPGEKQAEPFQIALADEETEIRQMALFAKKICLEGINAGQEVRIGCVVPRLEMLRDRVLRIFTEVFSEKNTITADPALLPFNISAGKKLTDWPVIHAAFLLLKLKNGALNENTLQELLRILQLGA